jgi:peptidoglycan hydrolase-like protein with peptidoglycan-binding domain
MLDKIAFILCSVLLMWPAWSATQKASSAKKSAAATSKKKAATSSKKAASTAKSSSKKKTASRSSRSRRSRASWRNRQLHPTEERYAEIERALAEKGYLKVAPNGKWDEASTEAVREFQRDQKLEPSGKLDSLTLIALGLGPKYDTATSPPPPGRQP